MLQIEMKNRYAKLNVTGNTNKSTKTLPFIIYFIKTAYSSFLNFSSLLITFD